MRIVCLAWGSLIWNPGVLPIAGNWYPGGPSLPIEFARVGDKGELATVLCPSYPTSPARWARLDESDLVTARQLLRRREEVDPDRHDGIGSVIVGQTPGVLFAAADILQWTIAQRGIDAVIWTALPPRFDNIGGRISSPKQAVGYLLKLRGHERRHAEEYVHKAPEEIQTANRAALERAIAS